jgi:hypothetical protein
MPKLSAIRAARIVLDAAREFFDSAPSAAHGHLQIAQELTNTLISLIALI